MMGVSLCQWRYSIGMFNLKSVYQKHIKVNKSPLSLDQFFDIFASFSGSVPIKIIFGLLKVLAYSVMVISFLFIFLMSYPCFKFVCDETFGPRPYHTRTSAEYFPYIFIQISLLPCYLSASFRSMLKLFKKQVSETAKNILFLFLCYKFFYLYLGQSKSIRALVRSRKKSHLVFGI